MCYILHLFCSIENYNIDVMLLLVCVLRIYILVTINKRFDLFSISF